MSVNKVKHEELVSKWSRIVAECNARGIGESIDVWCEKNGISKWKLYYWKRALGNNVSAEQADRPETTAGQCLDITDVLTDSSTDPARREDGLKYSEPIAESQPHRELPSVNDARTSVRPNIMIQAGQFRIYVRDGVSEAAIAAVLKAVPHD